MKLATISYQNALRCAEWRDDRFWLFPAGVSFADLLGEGKPTLSGESISEDQTLLRAPYLPARIFAGWVNYAEHAAEMGNAVPQRPLLFNKLPSTVIGTGEAIRWDPQITQQVDWEGELGVVIGRGGFRVAEEEALAHIFGYTIANDISARDLQDAEPQWLRAKSMDTSCPLGPCVVTADAIPDPQALHVRTYVSGQKMQDGVTSSMFFKIAYLVAYLSRSFALLPGDLILTGTPAGVGKGMKPPRFLQAGDVVRVEIDGIGALENPCAYWD